MPFQTAKENLIRRPTLLVLFRDAFGGTPLSSTLAAAAAAGATTITVASGTNAKVGPIRIGAGEQLERADVTNVAGAVLTLARPLRFAFDVDTPVVEQVAYNLGDVDGDVSVSVSQESSDQQSAMRLLPFTILRGNLSIGMAARLLGTTIANFAVACGIPYQRITGAGTAASPTVMATAFEDVDSVEHASLAVVSRKNNGSLTLHELWSLSTDFTGVAIQAARAQNGAIPLSVMGLSAFLQYDLAPGASAPFAASVVNTFRGSKGNVFRELREVGVFERTGATATVNMGGGGAAADAVSVTLSGAISGVVAGDFVAFNADDLVEIHQVQTAGATLTLRTPLLRAQANGTVVQKVTKVPFFTVAPGGVSLNLGGSTAPIVSELRDLPIGMQPGSVQATLSFNTMDMLAANIARALGVPVSAIIGNAVLLSQLIAARVLDGVYAEGVTQDGRWLRMVAWGTTQEVQGATIALGSQAPAQLPFVVRPSSGLQLSTWTA